MNLQTTLRLLLAGQYICPIAFPVEHRVLESAEGFAAAEEWLSKIEMRIARLGESGAFFMAPEYPDEVSEERIRREFQQFRDVYGPVTSVLDVIRRAGGDHQQIAPGSLIELARLEIAIRENPALLNDLRAALKSGKGPETPREALERMAKMLLAERFIVPQKGMPDGYYMTGKIDKVMLVIDYLQAHVPEVFETVDDQIEEVAGTQDLFSGSQGET